MQAVVAPADRDLPHVGAVPALLEHGLHRVDVLAEGLLVHRVAVDVAQRHPGRILEPLEDDDPARQVAVRLLPEGLLPPPVELVEQRGDRVGEARRVHPRGVERVPGEALALEVELHVVVLAAARREHRLDVVAEVALHLQAETRRAALLVVGAPAQELLDERAHAGGGLAGAHRAEDDGAGVERLVAHHEPRGLADLLDPAGVMDLADDDRGLGVVGRERPRRQPAGARAARPVALEPHPPDGLGHRPEHEDQDAGREGRPHHQRPVPGGRLLPDEQEEAVVERERMRPHPPRRDRARGEEPGYHDSGSPSACQTSASATPAATAARRSASRSSSSRRRAATRSGPP